MLTKLQKWFTSDAISKADTIFDSARIKILFNLLVAFTLVNIYTLIVDVQVGSSIAEPTIIAIGIAIYITLLFRLRYSENIVFLIHVFLIYQISQPLLFGFFHTPNEGFDTIFIGFTLLSIICTFLLADGKYRPYIIVFSFTPYLHGLLCEFGHNPLPMLAAAPRELPQAILLVPLSLIIYVISDFSRLEILAKKELVTQKKEIEVTHATLTQQHDALFAEQENTKMILQKIENLFGQQVSEEVAQELIAQESDFEGKSLEVTVLFLDIRDFSKFADNKPPSEVASFQNIIFSELLNTIKEHRGITNQILGDGIMAVFGAPSSNDTHTIDAVQAGYALLGKINELIESKKIPQTRVGIGLHTGKVIAGNIGNDFRKQYSLTGSTVNIASRIEQLNKKYACQFLISEAVKTGIRNTGYPVTLIDEVSLKGIESNMKIYKLL